MKMRRIPRLFLALSVTSLGCAQQPAVTSAPAAVAPVATTPGFALGGVALTGPAAVLDPFAGITLQGADANGKRRELRLHFPALAWPAGGEHAVGDAALTAELDGAAMIGTLRIAACSPAGLRGTGELRPKASGDAPPLAVAFDLTPSLPPAAVHGAPSLGPGLTPIAKDVPDQEDLVFCAIGNGGTGWPGQQRVGRAVVRLAATGPLDFVLLLGDQFLPGGVQGLGDPQWQNCFERPYPADLLPMPFHTVAGDRDLLGVEQPLHEYASLNPRWNSRPLVYHFDVASHGRKVRFIGLDTQAYTEEVRNPVMRQTRRMLGQALSESDADFNIVFGHLPMWSIADEAANPRLPSLETVARNLWSTWGADLYLCAGDHCLAMVQPEGIFPQITSGGGAGPDLARNITRTKDTTFASTAGGFVWFRFDGTRLEVSFRDCDGQVLFVRHLRSNRKKQ